MRKKLIYSLNLLLVILLLGCSVIDKPVERETLPVTGSLTVAALDIGKADAIVIHTENKAMLIDTGEKDDGGKVLKYLETQGITKLDYMLITHYDKDHVGGADRILRSIEVSEVIRPDYVGVREEYKIFVADIAELGITDQVMSAGCEDLTFMLDDARVNVNAAGKINYVNSSGDVEDNNFSLVTRLQHGNKVLLFTGDSEDDRLAELIASDKDWSADYLKVPYHGNYTKRTASFIKRVNPTYAVICDSEKNPADEATIAALSKSEVFCTKSGSVIAVSDGKCIRMSQQ